MAVYFVAPFTAALICTLLGFSNRRLECLKLISFVPFGLKHSPAKKIRWVKHIENWRNQLSARMTMILVHESWLNKDQLWDNRFLFRKDLIA